MYRLRWFTPKAEAGLYAAVHVSEGMCEALGAVPEAAYMGLDLLCVLKNDEAVRNCVPDFAKVKELYGLLVHITARGYDEVDCVLRSFAPK